MWYLMFLVSTTSPVCEKLTHDYHSYEKTWGFLYRMHLEEAAIDQKFAEDLKDSKAMSEALALRKEAEALPRELAEKTDRILALMLAHKCKPPEHVASVFNHQEKDQSPASPR